MGLYRALPTLSEEIRAWRAGYRHVAGLDEAGRGPMAGPVVAAAVILDPQFAARWWSDLRDSKAISAVQRERLALLLRESAAVGVGAAEGAEVDDAGLIEATMRAMGRALAALPLLPDMLVVDAMTLPGVATAQRAVVHGDALCVSIAAASIVAKVERDRIMDEHDGTYPGYGFAHNRGYCTPDHLRALDERGPCPIHRRCFAPVRAYLEANAT